jgi:hypothetical protein
VGFVVTNTQLRNRKVNWNSSSLGANIKVSRDAGGELIERSVGCDSTNWAETKMNIKDQHKGMYIYGSDGEPEFIAKEAMSEEMREWMERDIAEVGSPGINFGHMWVSSVSYPIGGPFPDPARPETHDEQFAKEIAKNKAAKIRAAIGSGEHLSSTQRLRSSDPLPDWK